MNQFVTTSYRDARDADSAIEQLLARGYSRTDASVIMTDRTRRTYLNGSSTSPIGAIMTAPGSISKTMPIDDTDDVGTPIALAGPLSHELDRDGRTSKRLVDFIESLGANRRDAEAAARDVSSGGVFTAIKVKEQDLPTVRQLMNDRGKVTTSASRR